MRTPVAGKGNVPGMFCFAAAGGGAPLIPP